MDFYGQLVRRVLIPLWDRRIRRRPTLDHLARLRSLESRSLDQLVAFQSAELSRLLEHAYAHVPYYRQLLDDAGLSPSAIRGPADLPRLPILDRSAAQRAGDTRSSTAPPAPSIRKTTGGTTGEPLVIRYDRGSEHWRQAIKLRGFGYSGWRIGDPAIHYWGEPSTAKPAATRLKETIDRAVRREHYIDCTPRGDDHKAEVVRAIQRIRPRAIFCYAQAGAELARYIVRTGSRSWDTIPVICGAERVFAADRQVLEQAFGPAVFETYGCREVMLIATECSEHDGLHVQMENLVVEVVDDDGQPVGPGEVGRVVLTDLHNYGAPFIRYANGDMARWVDTDELCRCGRAHPRLAAIEGRQTETLRDASGQPVGGMVFNLAFSPLADSVRQFQAVQHIDGSITIKMVPAPGTDTASVIEHVEKSCARYLPGVSIAFETVEDIPVTRSGKRRVVVVETGDAGESS